MKLKTKFIILIGAIATCSYGLTFYRTSSFQEELVINQAVRQARMLHEQIHLTRAWIADHNGVFIANGPEERVRVLNFNNGVKQRLLAITSL